MVTAHEIMLYVKLINYKDGANVGTGRMYM